MQESSLDVEEDEDDEEDREQREKLQALTKYSDDTKSEGEDDNKGSSDRGPEFFDV